MEKTAYEELYNFYISSNMIMVIKSKRMEGRGMKHA
jgi:hypothetical protein